MAKRLPIVTLLVNGKEQQFYADERLKEYRAVDNPHHRYHESEVDAAMFTLLYSKALRSIGHLTQATCLEACKGAVTTIREYLDGTWDGNAEGWQAVIDSLETAIANAERA